MYVVRNARSQEYPPGEKQDKGVNSKSVGGSCATVVDRACEPTG